MGIHTKIVAESAVTADLIGQYSASFYLPYAKQALAETVSDLDMTIASGCEFRAEMTAQFVIERCEYTIGRMREALAACGRIAA